MALVSFTDSSGRSWRAWNVDRVRPKSSAEDYLEASFRDGWVVFETEDGAERRRLGNYPPAWAASSAEELERLCAAATPATRFGALDRADARGDHRAESEARS